MARMVDCTNCKQRFREDHLADPNVCPNCGAKGSFTEARLGRPVEEALDHAHDAQDRMFLNFLAQHYCAR